MADDGDLMEGDGPSEAVQRWGRDEVRPQLTPQEDTDDLTLDGQRRCTAKSRQTQKRCQRAATPGTTVCHSHGSNAPQVKRKAQLRLLELVEPGIGRLARIMAQGNDANALKAIEMILNRAGLHGRVEIDVTVATDLLRERAAQYLQDHPELDLGAVIDAEVIEPQTSARQSSSPLKEIQ